MELTKEQSDIVGKALSEYLAARLASERTGAHLNDLCIAIAGPGYQLQPTPEGGFVLRSAAEAAPQPVMEKRRGRRKR